MDSLTQIVLGAAVGEAILGKKIGNKALLYGAIAGTIPDLDVLANYLTDTVTATELHRGFSHSILFCLIVAPLLGALVNKIERRYNLGLKPWAQLFFWGLFTHPILDAFTTWGTQLFWPFQTRLAFNSIFVIDPLYTLPFLACTVALMFYKRNSKTRRKLNQIGIIISTFYLINTVVIKYAVHNRFEKALNEQQLSYSKISTRPSPMNTVLWNANIETKDSYLIADYSLLDTKPISFTSYPKHREQSQAIRKHPKVQRLIAISNGWFLMEQKADQWYFYDLRFGLLPKKDQTESFVFAYTLKEDNGALTVQEVPKSSEDATYAMSVLWQRLKGN
ncbi:metal-dependent hydrolase [Sediminibacter sp. Hel_I_10]|uniref:metal-dependent hydrolase n=1 Tax=Sediminibacter sp. Hel_I_10 TaxID=1392490 RepID=UPI00047BBB33|nr:metal-dependent hydrolase [Sediminibacter sp. Hel_I_10]